MSTQSLPAAVAPTTATASHQIRLAWGFTALFAASTSAALALLPQNTPGILVLLLAGIGVGVCEALSVSVPVGQRRWNFSASEIVLACCLFLFPGAWLILAVILGAAIAMAAQRQRAIHKVAFNITQHAALAALAVTVTLPFDNRPLGVFVALSLTWVTNVSVMTALLRVETDKLPWRYLSDELATTCGHAGTNICLGVIAGVLAALNPYMLTLMVPPAIYSAWACALIWRESNASAVMSSIVASISTSPRTGHFDAHAAGLLRAGYRVLRADSAQLVVIRPENSIGYRLDAAADDALIHPLDLAHGLKAMWWVYQAQATQSPTATGYQDGMHWVTMRSGSPRAPRAIMVLQRSKDKGRFSRSEMRLAAQLLDHTSLWVAGTDHDVLSSATRTDATSALELVERSLNRLQVAANAPNSRVDDLVSELDRLEKSVAELIGSRSVAAAPAAPDTRR